MTSHLPEAFITKMKSLLGEEFDAFYASYEDPRYYGLRVNTTKVSTMKFLESSPFELQPIPWCKEGFYYTEEARPGKHPYYHAGLYYIQEPSAMVPVELLNVQPGERVLDLCAAPGGKSTQIAAKLEGKGLLVANDNAAERVKALTKNIELFGIRNSVIVNEVPERLARSFQHYFDKILIDAPCSGEGMFRKEEEMAKQWEKHSVEKCVLMQRDILQSAAALLAPGGRIVYSTCTFSPEENEMMIAEFLDNHSEFTITPVPLSYGLSSGRVDWLSSYDLDTEQMHNEISGTGRIWPHKMQGEGHFFAILQHDGTNQQESVEQVDVQLKKATHRMDKATLLSKEELEWVRTFIKEALSIEIPDNELMHYGSHVYWSKADIPSLEGLKVSRPGWFIGTLKKNRFEPSHPLALGLTPQEVRRSVSFSSGESDCIRYLKGETLHIDKDQLQWNDQLSPKGYCLVCVDGFALGWGKWQDGMLKNEYSAGWRWT